MEIRKTLNGFVISDKEADLFYMRPVFNEKTGELEIKVVRSFAVIKLTLTESHNGYFGRHSK